MKNSGWIRAGFRTGLPRPAPAAEGGTGWGRGERAGLGNSVPYLIARPLTVGGNCRFFHSLPLFLPSVFGSEILSVSLHPHPIY